VRRCVLLTAEAKEMVRRLAEETYQRTDDPYTTRPWWRVERSFTAEEWEFLSALVEEGYFICVPLSSGFRMGMDLYSHPPNTGVHKPERVITIEPAHLDGVFPERLNSEQCWALFSPFTHSDNNKRLLKHHGVDPPREQSHCEY